MSIFFSYFYVQYYFILLLFPSCPNSQTKFRFRSLIHKKDRYAMNWKLNLHKERDIFRFSQTYFNNEIQYMLLTLTLKNQKIKNNNCFKYLKGQKTHLYYYQCLILNHKLSKNKINLIISVNPKKIPFLAPLDQNKYSCS